MLGAASTHLPNGFFMNWFGTLPAGSEGFEYHLLMIGLAGIVALGGSGAWSLDLLLARPHPVSIPNRITRAAA
jgi:putative oxidoreductase